MPVGAGHGGALKLKGPAFDRVLVQGPRILLAEHGIGTAEDVEHTESEGCLEGADPAAVSERARVRGADQLGTLGSGNHFLEVQRVAKVLDSRAAEVFGLRREQVTVLIHSGSRGFGHQVCTDYVRVMDAVQARYRITAAGPGAGVRAAELAGGAAVPGGDGVCGELRLGQPGGARAPRARVGRARSSGRAWRRARARSTTWRTTSPSSRPTTGETLCVHRKGATRAFPAGSPEIPSAYREVGQPVFIPGSMGTSSFVLVGLPGAMERSFGTTCHGAGRRMSRTGARRKITGAELRHQLEARGDRGALSRPTAAWPRRRRSPTRTSSASWRWSSRQVSRGAWRSWCRSASSRDRRCLQQPAGIAIGLLGDVMLGRMVAEALERQPPESAVGPGAARTGSVAGPGGVQPRVLHLRARPTDDA